MRLTELAIKRPAMMSMVFILFVFLGGMCAPLIGVDLYPPVNIPYITVVVAYPGAGPEEIESQVLKPIEDAVSPINGIKNIYSTASEGKAVVSVEFSMSTDQETAAMDVQKNVDAIRYKLPEDAEQPIYRKVDLNSEPVIILALSGDRPLEDVYQTAKDTVEDRIQHIPGVAEVQLVGGKEKEIQVAVDKNKLNRYGLSITGLVGAIAAQNLNVPAGRMDQPENEYLMRIIGQFDSIEDLKNMPVSLAGGGQIRLSDVAAVSNGFADIRTYGRMNGRDAVAIEIHKQSTASMVETVDRVISEIPEIQRVIPDGLKLEVVQNNATFVHRTLNDTRRNLIEGILTTALVLYLFLREWRSTLIVGLAIPTSLIATLTMMYFFGFSFNVLTLMGLTMCIGILVDDSIVVLENIHRHRMMGKDAASAALEGRTEIGMAAIAITMSDVVVFAPIAFMTGMVGQFFKQFGLTVVFAALFSLLVSFTLTPMLASLLFKGKEAPPDELEEQPGDKQKTAWERFQHKVYLGYQATLEWSMVHRKTIVMICFVAPLLAFSLLPLGGIKTEFMPRSDQSQLTLTLEMPAGTSLTATDQVLRRLENRVRRMPEVASCFATVGKSGEDYTGSNNAQNGNIKVRLVPKEARDRAQWEIAQEMRGWGLDIPGAVIKVMEPTGVNQPQMPPIYIHVSGPDAERVNELSEQVRTIVSRTAGTRDIDSSFRLGQPEIHADIDWMAAGAYGLSVSDIAGVMRCAFSGQTASVLRKGGEETNIRVSLDGADHMYASDIGALTVPNRSGQFIPLNQVATITEKVGLTTIRRLNRQRLVTIKANMSGRTLGEIMADIQSDIGKLDIPHGYSITYEGETKDMQESFAELLRALIISIAFVYAILVMLYESYLVPVIRMLSLPLGMVGAFLAMAVTGQTLSLPSFIGLIMLDGLVAKNSTLLIDYTHTIMAREGLSLRQALVKAGTTRLRPIVMTTVTMIAGMLPTALATSTGSEIRKGMAIALIGGLLLSTLLTLLVIPVAYTLLDDLRRKVKRKKTSDVPAA